MCTIVVTLAYVSTVGTARSQMTVLYYSATESNLDE